MITHVQFKMKIITCIVLLIAASSLSLLADYFSPFADSKIDTTVTSGGQVVAVERKDGGTDYFIRVRVCCGGPLDIPAEIPQKLVQAGMSGKNAAITATIREKEDATKKSKTRYLEVTKIEISK